MSSVWKSLQSGLESASLDERRTAAAEIARRADEAAGLAVSLIQAATDDDDEVKQWSSSALEDMGPPLIKDAAAIAALLGHPHADAAYWAATLLGRLGPEAANVAEQLSQAAQSHGTPAVRRRAAWALEKISSGARAS